MLKCQCLDSSLAELCRGVLLWVASSLFWFISVFPCIPRISENDWQWNSEHDACGHPKLSSARILEEYILVSSVPTVCPSRGWCSSDLRNYLKLDVHFGCTS